ncbi:glycerol 3-phosphate phosphatase [Pontimonas salivibrio]|uniref:Glycerol 3-phosphate phosphatase n=2 Tax=Pontimonas salivibrio TaxID=1159327 RepID=A0A2L2BR41_9MICO|nr:glycerol 3-phosphate phosphatase [Pontimonas salivibrio]
MMGFTGRSGKTDTPLAGKDALFLDLDGVIYRGPDPIDYAVESINQTALPVAYLTNNASRTPEQVADQLRGYGLELVPEHVVTSPQAAVALLKTMIPAASTVLVVGGEGLLREIAEAGFSITTSADDEPVAVVQGFSPEVGWPQLAEGSFAIQRDPSVVWVATNTDWTIPVQRGVAPGNGALVSAVHLAVGRLATFAGKPERAMFDVAARRMAVSTPLMVGDRLDTDIKGARAAGISSAVVLTGIDQAKQILAAGEDQRPDYILQDLRQLHLPYPEIIRSVDRDDVHTVEVGKAVVRRKGHVVRVARAGEKIDLLRAGAACIYDSGLKIFGLDVDPALYSDKG